MAKCWSLMLLLALLFGCGPKPGRMDQPEDPQGRYRDQIAAAKKLLEQEEQWADRADWEVIKTRDGWQCIAWRIEHPERKGASRYVPWGYSIIELDSRLVTISYRCKG